MLTCSNLRDSNPLPSVLSSKTPSKSLVNDSTWVSLFPSLQASVKWFLIRAEGETMLRATWKLPGCSKSASAFDASRFLAPMSDSAPALNGQNLKRSTWLNCVNFFPNLWEHHNWRLTWVQILIQHGWNLQVLHWWSFFQENVSLQDGRKVFYHLWRETFGKHVPSH